MAAVLVLVVGFGAFHAVASRSAVVLASELALDHLKCFGLLEDSSGPPDARALEAKLHERWGWSMRVPEGSPSEGLVVVGGRKCLYHDGGIAHLMYRYRGEPVSLFMLPNTTLAAHTLAVMGHQTRIWSVGNTSYAVVMQGDSALVDRVALELRRTVR
jgi:anti-sigma factor RsiW